MQNYKPIIINMVILQKLVSETPLGTPITVITNIIQSSSEMIMLNKYIGPNLDMSFPLDFMGLFDLVVFH